MSDSAHRIDRHLVALDIDGTLLHDDGSVTERVRRAVAAVVAAGHELMIATGRSVDTTLPVLHQLGIAPRYTVCSNGAVTIRRESDDDVEPPRYRKEVVETFDPTAVLTTIRDALQGARYAVEDRDGYFRYTEEFPTGSVGRASEQVRFEDLLGMQATRVVVISPNHGMEDFLQIVEKMGLHRVSYAVGWTAWLDIAPDGVNKATALERLREQLDIPRDKVVAIGDGRNDIEMLEWAGAHGRGVAMGQAPSDVLAACSQVTAPVTSDGAAAILESLL